MTRVAWAAGIVVAVIAALLLPVVYSLLLAVTVYVLVFAVRPWIQKRRNASHTQNQ